MTTGVIGNFTPVKVAVPLPVAAACFSNRVNDFPAPTAGIVNTHAVEAVNVAVKTVPADIARVDAVVTTPIATTVSVYPDTVGVLSVGDVSTTN